jgi:hypothetical protein
MKHQNEYKFITIENDLYKKDLCRSRILECKINGFILPINKYRKLLTFIYSVLLSLYSMS